MWRQRGPILSPDLWVSWLMMENKKALSASEESAFLQWVFLGRLQFFYEIAAVVKEDHFFLAVHFNDHEVSA
ncbi:MAG: hypothetical protein JPMHGGIA_00679 [Saprospiraceae bacterium]|mgnify:FL=1|jgi:hypothetical protein|nr:hypothetical protein [Saprospiraceae bacterium]